MLIRNKSQSQLHSRASISYYCLRKLITETDRAKTAVQSDELCSHVAILLGNYTKSIFRISDSQNYTHKMISGKKFA